MSDRKMKEYEQRFYRAMEVAYRVFGDRAFRKCTRGMAHRPPISKTLFDTISVNIDGLTREQQEVLVQRSSKVNEKLESLFEKDKDFDTAIAQGAASGVKRLHYRFEAVRRMFEEVLNAD